MQAMKVMKDLTKFFEGCNIEPFSNDAEWHKQRALGIGGSEAGTILGVNKYSTKHELWEQKTGRVERPNISNEAIEKGKRLEPVIIDLFQGLYLNRYKVIDTKDFSLTRKDKPYLRANLDGALIETNTGRKGILEIKTTTINNMRQFDDWRDDGVPDSYYCQVLHYLNITGFDFAIIYCLADKPWENSSETFYRFIDANDVDVVADMQLIEKEEDKFWKEVTEDIEPNFL